MANGLIPKKRFGLLTLQPMKSLLQLLTWNVATLN